MVRRSRRWNVRSSLLGVLLAARSLGCAGVEGAPVPGASRRPEARARETSGAQTELRVGAVRVIHGDVDARQPLVATTQGSEMTLSFALRDLEGVTVALDPESLDVRDVGIHMDPARETKAPQRSRPAPFVVGLSGGASVAFWTDLSSSSVVAQLTNYDGVRSLVATISKPSMVVIGSPSAATSDGRHIVVTFVTSARDGFELVAATVERSP